jgi:hypothetical protein
MDLEYRKNVWNACMENKYKLTKFGKLVVHHVFVNDKKTAEMVYWRDDPWHKRSRSARNFEESYRAYYSRDEHLSEIKMKCDLYGIEFADCVDLVKLYLHYFMCNTDSYYSERFLGYCDGE